MLCYSAASQVLLLCSSFYLFFLEARRKDSCRILALLSFGEAALQAGVLQSSGKKPSLVLCLALRALRALRALHFCRFFSCFSAALSLPFPLALSEEGRSEKGSRKKKRLIQAKQCSFLLKARLLQCRSASLY